MTDRTSDNMIRAMFLAIIATAVLSACSTTPRAPGFGIQVSHEKFQTEVQMVVSGKGFTPGGRATINIFDFPRRGNIGPLFANVNSDGTFERRESFSYRTVPRDEEFAPIRVTVRDDTSGNASA